MSVIALLDRHEIESLISTVPIPIQDCVELEKGGYMRFSGNQHNESWEWVFKALENKIPDDDSLYKFYLELKRRHKNDRTEET